MARTGQNNGRSKYTDEQVRNVWQSWLENLEKPENERKTKKEIAELHGFPRSNLHDLTMGRHHTQITGIDGPAKEKRNALNALNKAIRSAEQERSLPDHDPRVEQRLADLRARKKALKEESEENDEQLSTRKEKKDDESRRCSTCKKTFPISNFNWHNERIGKRKTRCKDCQHENENRKRRKRVESQENEMVLKPGEQLVECRSGRHEGDRMVPESFSAKVGRTVMCRGCRRAGQRKSIKKRRLDSLEE